MSLLVALPHQDLTCRCHGVQLPCFADFEPFFGHMYPSISWPVNQAIPEALRIRVLSVSLQEGQGWAGDRTTNEWAHRP